VSCSAASSAAALRRIASSRSRSAASCARRASAASCPGLRQLPPRPRRDRGDLQVKRRGVGEGGEFLADPLVKLALRAQPGEHRRVLPPGLLKQLAGALLRGGNRSLLPNGRG